MPLEVLSPIECSLNPHSDEVSHTVQSPQTHSDIMLSSGLQRESSPTHPDPGSLVDIEEMDEQPEPALPGAAECSSTVPHSQQLEDQENEDLSSENIGLPPVICLEELKIAQGFIDALKKASLDNGKLPDDVLHQETYNAVREAILQRYPEDTILSYDQMKRRITELTGIVPIVHDMCINTCIAYTGPDFTDLDSCPMCSQPCYDQVKLRASGGKQRISRKVFHTFPIGPQIQALKRSPEGGESIKYCARCTEKLVNELGSNNGAIYFFDDFLQGQEYLDAIRDGKISSSDTVLMLSLDGAQLYQSKHVILGSIIPGPEKPKNKDGLPVWDAADNSLSMTYPFLHFVTADGPGMTYLNGLVSHHGRCRCRLYCGIHGCCKLGRSHYFFALLKPIDYDIPGSNHDDIILESRNDAEYRDRRLETGIAKPSIFLGLPPRQILGVPAMFVSDLMHLGSLNLPDIHLGLWRGTLKLLQGDTWKAHGEAISSGYKAQEFQTYLHLVSAIHLVHQRGITQEQVAATHRTLILWEEEFATLYYHIHGATHLASEIIRVGPPGYYTQWTMERTIGNLGEEIKQHSNPFANLSQHALRHCQVNALKAMVPELEPPEKPKRGSCDIGRGYVLLRVMDSTAKPVQACEGDAIRAFLIAHEQQNYSGNWFTNLTVTRWARLHLPTGQIARSLWNEACRPLEQVQIARNVKIQRNGRIEFGEVQYYFQMRVDEKPRSLAMMLLYSSPDATLLESSSGTVWACEHLGERSMIVVDVGSIISVVGMVPHQFQVNGKNIDRFFVLEKMGLEVTYMGGVEEEDTEVDT
ncbi:hypothetical protein BKA93DRAFT_819140 [Sparassis latifolia]